MIAPPPCWLSRVLGPEIGSCRYRADGRPDRMHVGFTEHWLSKAPTGPHLSKQEANDPRLLEDGCRYHHGNFDNHFYKLTREQVGEARESFARDYNLEWKLEQDFGPVPTCPTPDTERVE